MLDITEHPIFLTSCFVTYATEFDHKIIIDSVNQIEKTQPSNKRSNAGGFQSRTIGRTEYDNAETANLFENLIIPAAKQIALDTGYPSTFDSVRYWYNINYRYSYNKAHIHPKSYLSGVYYIKVPADSGRIVFNRSETEIDRMDFIVEEFVKTKQTKNNIRINTEHWYDPTEGMLILFPGHVNHYVEQNLTLDADDKRISLSFNFF